VGPHGLPSSSGFSYGWFNTALMLEGRSYLPWLTNRWVRSWHGGRGSAGLPGRQNVAGRRGSSPCTSGVAPGPSVKPSWWLSLGGAGSRLSPAVLWPDWLGSAGAGGFCMGAPTGDLSILHEGSEHPPRGTSASSTRDL